MSSPTNSYNNTSYSAYIAEMRQYIANRKADDTQTRNLTPSYNFPIYPDLVQISDSVTATAGGSGTPSTQSDSVNVSDAVTNSTYTTGTFTLCLKGDGSDQSAPAIVAFCDLGA